MLVKNCRGLGSADRFDELEAELQGEQWDVCMLSETWKRPVEEHEFDNRIAVASGAFSKQKQQLVDNTGPRTNTSAKQARTSRHDVANGKNSKSSHDHPNWSPYRETCQPVRLALRPMLTGTALIPQSS